MSSSNTSYNPLRIAAIATGVVATATVSYAIYFDYKRRHDPVFRKKLLRDQRKAAKSTQKEAETGKAVVEAALRRALVLINAQPVPDTPESKEQYFMEQVSQGEALAARSPEFFIASAIAFYKALKVYPAPQELIMIYQKTQPPPVFDLVMELITLEYVTLTGLVAAFRMSGLASSSTSRDPRDGSSDPLLEEIDDASPSQQQAQAQASSQSSSTPSSASGASSASPTSSGSFVVVDDESNQTPAATTTETVEVEVRTTGIVGEDPPEEPLN
ncbi:BZ3500_MvSof-1268-A1-R1_Chr10-1g02685 [Microbotryum saponariae]|uniref:BZ3500_MvSof-1268-A1-R1_Chr10-1g02685 protein n=1 Tax=Microbotryum saponariae TaxID=289078 RepID=A0A2X0LGL7_9BASI|nr:BZ3500_MvSof-1268-A1-R1_Chr10-1g02685 [Microbotryum saponariae]SDA06174.1 BZ3501_MvSof-1269-A2-R1_Chr10-1g02286 [Microbotryum saponariae]